MHELLESAAAGHTWRLAWLVSRLFWQVLVINFAMGIGVAGLFVSMYKCLGFGQPKNAEPAPMAKHDKDEERWT